MTERLAGGSPTTLRELYEEEGVDTERYASSSFWDARYHTERKRHIECLLEGVVSRGDNFLDVGCGTGEYLSIAQANGAAMVVGADLAAAYLDRLHGRLESMGLVQADGVRLPFTDDSFDVVLCSEVIEHIPQAIAAQAMNELARVARRSVCITTPNRAALIRRAGRRVSPERIDGLDAEVGHINLLDRDSLTEMAVSAGLRVVSIDTRHISPPILGESAHLPSSFAPLVARIERWSNRLASGQGNTMYAVLEPTRR